MPKPTWCRFVPAALAALLPAAAPARAGAGWSGAPLAVIRDAETETLLRTFATPLLRAAGLHANLVRIIVIRDDAINSFVSTGNRMFIPGGMIEKAQAADALAGVMAHQTGGDGPAAHNFARQAESSLPAGPGPLRAQHIARAATQENRLGDEP